MFRFALCIGAAFVLLMDSAKAQQAPPPIWLENHGNGPAIAAMVAAADAVEHENPGRRIPGDLLYAHASNYPRVARLTADYAAHLSGARSVTLPAGTVFVPVTYIRVYHQPPGEPAPAHQELEAAPNTTHWCAITGDGAADCFFYAADGKYYLTTSSVIQGPPSSRVPYDAGADPVPAPPLVEAQSDIEPTTKRVYLESVSAAGYVVRTVSHEAGRDYTRIENPAPWNRSQQTWIVRGQRITAAPVTDASGTITGADVTFDHDAR